MCVNFIRDGDNGYAQETMTCLRERQEDDVQARYSAVDCGREDDVIEASSPHRQYLLLIKRKRFPPFDVDTPARRRRMMLVKSTA
jgi:hypothetical protein